MTMRAVFHEEGDAREVEARLRRSGFDAAVVQERLAGEDDDEDHPWAVLTDAPEPVVEVLVEERDGWLDHGPAVPDPGASAPAPLELPDGPRRVKGHWRDA